MMVRSLLYLKVSDKMIRKLIESDRDSVLKYLYIEGSLNIFIIGDIEIFGFEQDFQFIYGEFDEFNNYLSVLLFYRENTIFYSHNRLFNIEWKKTFENHTFSYLSGAANVMDKLIPYFKEFKVHNMHFAEAYKLDKKPENSKYDLIKATTEEHCEKLFELLKSIDQFGYDIQSKTEFVKSKMNGINMGSTYFIEEEGKIISTVSATAETTKSAMVIAVATAVNARKKGLATILLKHLMNEYFEEKHKYLCLFYDNPMAGTIYKRLGFKDVDKWVMLSKE